MTRDNWNPPDEERFALALVPVMKEIADFVREKLPTGTDFGVLILVPSTVPGEEGRVLAITSDRRRVAVGAAQWVLTALER
jgi:hypothetical protein